MHRKVPNNKYAHRQGAKHDLLIRLRAMIASGLDT